MPTPVNAATISRMVESLTVPLCEHDREPDNCPICAAEAEEALLDPLTRAVAERIQRPDQVVELTGVPLS